MPAAKFLGMVRIGRVPMTNSLPITPPADSPLQEAHRQALALSRLQIKPILKAAKVASFNGWTLSVIAVLSAPFALFGVAGAMTSIGLALFAYIEFRGRRQLLRLDPLGALVLGWNQLGLLAMLVCYSAWMLWTALSGQGPFAAELQAQPELGDALGSLDGFDALYRTIVIAFYGAVIAISAIFQGLTAAYYFSRRKFVVAYLRDTPPWILQLESNRQDA